MTRNADDILVGDFNVSNDECDVDERSDSSSVFFVERGEIKKTSKKTAKGRTTPGSTITLQPDAFRDAMNPEEGISSSTGLLQNTRGENNQEETGNSLNNSSTITPSERYDPAANRSCDETTQIHQKIKHRKNRKSVHSKRVERKKKKNEILAKNANDTQKQHISHIPNVC
jgi:hypothetical protein